jgi:hypothetical protein
VSRLEFKYESVDVVTFVNEESEPIGWIERVRVGSWMQWVYFLNDSCYLSAGCSDEVREALRKLNSRCKTGTSKKVVKTINEEKDKK